MEHEKVSSVLEQPTERKRRKRGARRWSRNEDEEQSNKGVWSFLAAKPVSPAQPFAYRMH